MVNNDVTQLIEIPIDLEHDELITLSEGLRRLPTRPSPPTAWRWRTKGINGVRLPVARCGSKWITSTQAMAEFVRRQTPVQPVAVATGRTPEQIRQLKAAGLL